ncbi:Tubulin-specific chaperone D [Tetrabaena socialis]|uniref:Tubulin-specific chaperone D n=1 Tax=Tetrabaena socialis TaxID=47790 RepID=A0A2J8AAT8_9CHLO|nr:Tubulin-specific chaperone D [Tetrabaena socialis]|eukprot:PNH09641.1 Tubulin-specific chaperone D [Tetrabaena socialis]
MEPVIDEDQSCGPEFFEEAVELDGIVRRVVSSDGKDAYLLYDRYKAILCKYQEQAQLLDAYLESIVVPLANLLRKQAVLQQESGLHRALGTCRLLNVLVVVRGYKTVVRFFPHEAADLERVVDILESVKAQQPKDSEEGLAMWEAQTMLLLWLSILILIPFDLATVDSAALGADSGGAPYTALVGRILALCQDYLHHPGVLPCLRASLEDYTTDNRGDVGSWVREAAMGVMSAAVAALARCLRAAGGGGEAEAELADVMGGVVGLLLRQSVERIARVREAALRHVRTLLADPLLAPHIPAAPAVAAAAEAASAAADAGGAAAPLEALQRVVVRLLAVPPFTGPLLEGLVASIGGVDASLAKVASAALLEAAYLACDPRAAASFRSRYADAYASRLHDPNVAVRRGYSLALGCLPGALLRPMLDEALDALVEGCVPEDSPDERDVESRVACTKALGLLVATLYGGEEEGSAPSAEGAQLLREKPVAVAYLRKRSPRQRQSIAPRNAMGASGRRAG